MLEDYFRLAFNGLRQRRLRSWLTMLGIFIGIAAVVSLISLGQGLQMAIMSQFVALGGNSITVQTRGGGFGPPGTLSATNITTNDMREVDSVSGVDRVFGRLVRTGKVDFNDKTRFLYIGSMPIKPEDRDFIYEFRDMHIQDGRFLDPGDGYKVVIGNKYNVDTVFDRTINVGDKVRIQERTFDVVGVLERTGSPEVNIALFVNEGPLRDIFGVKDEYDVLLALTSEGQDVSLVADSIKKRLRNYRDVDEGKEDFTVETSEELVQTFSTIIQIVQIVLIGIAGISLFVGGVGITNTMYTAVLERTREIGIMKAIGARNRNILMLFLIESGMLGMAGGIVGIALGILLSKIVEWVALSAGFDLVQAYFPWYLILGALAFSFAVGSLSGLAPARRASRMNPVEALRK
ncbi:ABC transporter permease [Nanoarchaeota archaeon]